jgi:anti-sigma regulatory factor (Ser/Thr protein kinase)
MSASGPGGGVADACAHGGGFRHEAFLHAGDEAFLAGTVPFLRDGAAAGEAMLVVVDRRRIDLLRARLGATAEHVGFADMAQVGANPARIIPAWRDFVAEHARPDRGLRGIGEPIWPGRAPDVLTECHLHESLLNRAFADTPGFRLMCPYDTEALPGAVIDDALRTHPLITGAGGERASDVYAADDWVRDCLAEPLPDPAGPAEEMPFRAHTLAALRGLVARRAREAGLGAERTGDLLFAVNEVATNSVRHAGGEGRLRVWREPDRLVCEVRDGGRIDEPLVGRRRPERGQLGGYGLWVVHQLCDLVQMRRSPDGNVVRLHLLTG